MARSTMSDILRVVREINTLDKRGKLAILRDLQKQNLCHPDVMREPVKEKGGEGEEL